MLIVFALYCKEVQNSINVWIVLKATTWRVFEIYNNQAGPDGFNQSFSSWLSSTSYQDQIATGKSKSVSSAHFSNYLKMLKISSFLYRLEWERKIPDDKISTLKDLMNVINSLFRFQYLIGHKNQCNDNSITKATVIM